MVRMNLGLGRLAKNGTLWSPTLFFTSYSRDSCHNKNPRQAGLLSRVSLEIFAFQIPDSELQQSYMTVPQCSAQSTGKAAICHTCNCSFWNHYVCKWQKNTISPLCKCTCRLQSLHKINYHIQSELRVWWAWKEKASRVQESLWISPSVGMGGIWGWITQGALWRDQLLPFSHSNHSLDSLLKTRKEVKGVSWDTA